MKFGEMFMEYRHGDQEWFLNKFSHVEYKRLKKVLKSCRTCKSLGEQENEQYSQLCQCESCPLCDQMFFSELMKEASDIAGCFSSRARHLLHLHVATGMQRYVLRLRQCFRYDQKAMVEEGRMLIEYITMNAIAMRKILKKYDKVHGSVNGKNFKSKMRSEHMELLQSPWLIELGAFYLNSNGLDGDTEYDLTCAICLETVFNPYALSCGHLFCKLCACSAASVLMLQGLKSASPDSKCPVCRELSLYWLLFAKVVSHGCNLMKCDYCSCDRGVYANAVHMLELDLLLKRRCKEYWKERLVAERAELVKQSKEYWDVQTKYAIGY